MANTLFGQSLNEYKYVIVSSKYGFQKSEDQYQLNSLTKFLFEKEGFNVIYNSLELPTEVVNNPCLALTAEIINESNMFTTKLVIELKNCKNQKVFVSKEGRSKEKEYKAGYQEALRKAFESVKEQNYSYSVPAITEVVEEDIIEVNENISQLDEAEIEDVVMESTESSNLKVDNRDRDSKGNILGVPTEKMLYAQENRLGYQLVDSTPKIVFILLKTGKKDVYFLKNRTGTFYKEEGKWFAEYYFDGHLMKQEFEVKW
ncbi:hypothetical protein EGM88_02415 [Aureibaculum marinum]|uniref:Uncharacterized protein n=2 Tax=Aureibaculum marinum TaxID=2487930 RepID=A0A3N4P5I1_9FLAO|nr:hypothetical protein EGM88_02415 [Aureibaculum marinum]